MGAVLFVLALVARHGGRVIEVGLSIASVAYGALLGVFLLGVLTRTATERSAMVGMVCGLALSLYLWIFTGVMIETTNVSVGRGTDTPFKLVGAPWVDAHYLADYLNSRQIDGVRFVPVNFTPTASVYADQKRGGVNIIVTARDSLDAPELGLEIAAALQHLYPQSFKIEQLDVLMRNHAVLGGLVSGEDPRRIAEDLQDAANRFITMREKYLLY